jgi:PleD family two-component response regulator
MSDTSTVTGTPLVLVINDEEWTTRSIESILRPKGYAVLMAYTGRQGMELATKIRPDLLLIDLRLPDITGIDLCARMRKLPTVRPSTPVLLFTSGSMSRSDRLAGFRAGAWGMLQPPFNPEEFLARIGPYISAKRDADAALETSHLDPLTGFYNLRGLMRRAVEMSADTARTRRPLACVALGPPREGDAAPSDPAESTRDPDFARTLGNVLLSVTRLSDAVGRMGEGDFIIVAPGTDGDGAARLVQRVVQAVEAGAAEDERLRDLELRAGFYAAAGSGQETVIPEELLRRATDALRNAQSGRDGNPIRAFEA